MRLSKYLSLLASATLLILSFIISFNLENKTRSQYQSSEQILGTNYLAQSSCTEPSGGCGDNYYWDSYYCSCMPYEDSTCTEPAEGCPTDYYWDSEQCTCVYSGSSECTEPSGGCGDNYYWDSSTCSCVYSGTESCTEPSEGCGTNYYWDSGSCSCVYSGSCQEPSEGCGTDHYWDSERCMCISNDPSCQEPSSGCGDGYYWDSYNCYCRTYESYCEPQDCGTDYYWDSGQCTCVYSGSSECTEPSGGCGEGYYWDSYYCSCRQEYESNTCYEPSSDCGEGYYWDSYSCSCVSTTGTGGYDSTSLTSSGFDRLAYESSERISCVRSKLSDSQYKKLRYYQPQNEQEEQEIMELGRMVESCWGDYDYESDTAKTPEKYIEAEKCLINNLGKSAFEEIYKGSRKPTHEEHLVFEACFGNRERSKIVYSTADSQLPSQSEECLINVLGEDLYNKVVTDQEVVPYDLRTKVDRCFGVKSQPFEESPHYEVPSEVKNCLVDAVGESRFNEINSGRSLPTQEEKTKGQACFQNINPTQKKFLPSPPEEVPFLDEDKETIKVSKVDQEKRIVKRKTYGGKITLNGNGPPNSTVTIYIYSEPVVVTTTTDENGVWVYELNKPLEGEKHVAYATVKTADGRIVRSSVFDFSVSAAEEIDAQAFLDEESAINTQRRFAIYAIILVVFASLAVLLLKNKFGYKKEKVEKASETKSDKDKVSKEQ